MLNTSLVGIVVVVVAYFFVIESMWAGTCGWLARAESRGRRLLLPRLLQMEMSIEKRAASKYDQRFADETKQCTLVRKQEIFDLLQARIPGVLKGSSNDYTRATLRELAKKHKIRLVVEEERFEEGWVGKAKGAFQLCYERGLIQLEDDRIKSYKACLMDDKVGEDGEKILGLRSLVLDNCGDFEAETTMLEYVASKYGWKVEFSPVCTPEIAGIGIEYDWASSKNSLNRIPLSDRKGYSQFKSKCLDKCFSATGVMGEEVVRGNAKQARTYMIAYLLCHTALADKGEETLNEDLSTGVVTLDELKKTVTSIPCQVIEKSRKSYRSHRGIAMFDMNTNSINYIKKEEN